MSDDNKNWEKQLYKSPEEVEATRIELELAHQKAQTVAALDDRQFYERLGRVRQAADAWFSPRLQTDLEILINFAEKYRELSNRAVETERKS